MKQCIKIGILGGLKKAILLFMSIPNGNYLIYRAQEKNIKQKIKYKVLKICKQIVKTINNH